RAGLFRDSRKLRVLGSRACVAAIGRIPARHTVATGCGLGFISLQTPDASSSSCVLRGTHQQLVDPQLGRELGGREVLFLCRDTLVGTDGRLTIDPYSKLVNKVESGPLTVDGDIGDIPSPCWRRAMDAWEKNDKETLEHLNIGVVVEDEKIIYTSSAIAPAVPWILTSAWMLSPLLAGLAYAGVARSERRSNPTKLASPHP